MERDGAVGLRVEVNEEDASPAHAESGSEVDGGRRFTYSPLLVGDGDR
jgi:hypothetical protein